MPLRSALRDDTTPPVGAPIKAVQIAEPDVTDVVEAPLVEELPPRKQFTASVAKRLSGRAAVPPSSRNSIGSIDGLTSYMTSPAQLPADDLRLPAVSPLMRPQLTNPLQQHQHQQRHRNIDHISGRLLAQVAEWIQHERTKKESRKSRRVRSHGRKNRSPPEGKGKPRDKRELTDDSAIAPDDVGEGSVAIRHHRSASIDSNSSDVSLDRLQRIIDDNMSALGVDSPNNFFSGYRSSSISSSRRQSRALRYQPSRTASSDTEYYDGDVLVPGCDAVLDNSKTLKYASTSVGTPLMTGRSTIDGATRREEKERQAWYKFKSEIIRLAHTLRLKGWRKVPLDAGETITVERLSGALTNAVYVVSPPADLGGGIESHETGGSSASPYMNPAGGASSSSSLITNKRTLPNKLLLRIYGPQVEHLIDREKELSVLRRLARKKIGPRLLGTFANGRFEQFFTATTLTSANLREPETSKQIAKRMRELHDGIELLEDELDGGPTVWQNWDRWLDSVQATITFLDNEVRLYRESLKAAEAAGKSGDGAELALHTGPFIDKWKNRGYVCGVEWPVFKALLEKHREKVKASYGSSRNIRDRLTFAHNDTQYGNILRLRPDERSPLLQPENEHKQLIVIDFEYAAANPPGVEFANHFTEWTYNYHDSVNAHNCVPKRYPNIEQQRRFIRSYVDHRPDFPHQCASSTPRFGPMSLPLATLPEQPLLSGTPAVASSASSIADFMLDARAPPGGWVEEETRREELLERQVDELMKETRLWRAANSAMWVAWGIVQAKVPGFSLTTKHEADSETETEGEKKDTEEEKEKPADEEEFDYLGYSQERAFFVLGDCIQDGLITLAELPADVQAKVKTIDY